MSFHLPGRWSCWVCSSGCCRHRDASRWRRGWLEPLLGTHWAGGKDGGFGWVLRLQPSLPSLVKERRDYGVCVVVGEGGEGAWSCWELRALHRCSQASQQRSACVSRPVGVRGGSKEWFCRVTWGCGSALRPWFLAGPYKREHCWPFCLCLGRSGCGQHLVGCSLTVSLGLSPLLTVLPSGPVSRLMWLLLRFPLKLKSCRSSSGCKLGVFLDNQMRGKLLKQCLDIACSYFSKLYLQSCIQINVML